MNCNLPELDLDSLLALCRQGDREAGSELFHRFNEKVEGWLRKLGGYKLTDEDRHDLRQEVFAKVWRDIGRFRGECSFGGWIYRQTYSIYIDDHRYRAAQSRKAAGGILALDAVQPNGQVTELPDRQPAPDELVARRDDYRKVHDALERLGPPDSPCREVIGLFYFGGFKYEEISADLNLNIKTVSTRLFKCVKKLAPLLVHHFPGRKKLTAATEQAEMNTPA